jgi:hypothetical protein
MSKSPMKIDELAAETWDREERRLEELRRAAGLHRARTAAAMLANHDPQVLRLLAGFRDDERQRLEKLLRTAQLLANRRGRPVLPHRVLEPITELLVTLQSFFEAIGVLLEDTRWVDAADGLAAAATWTRAIYSPVRVEDARRCAAAADESDSRRNSSVPEVEAEQRFAEALRARRFAAIGRHRTRAHISARTRAHTSASGIRRRDRNELEQRAATMGGEVSASAVSAAIVAMPVPGVGLTAVK